MDAVNINPNKKGDSYNKQRLDSIKKVNNTFAIFFLSQLHLLTWKDYNKGVQSTIPFDEAFDMLQMATDALYDLLIASVDDKYSKDLSMSQMRNTIKLHNLNNEFTLGNDIKKSRKKEK